MEKKINLNFKNCLWNSKRKFPKIQIFSNDKFLEILWLIYIISNPNFRKLFYLLLILKDGKERLMESIALLTYNDIFNLDSYFRGLIGWPLWIVNMLYKNLKKKKREKTKKYL